MRGRKDNNEIYSSKNPRGKKKRPFAPLHPREIDKIIMKELILLYTQVEKQDKRSI